MSGRLKVPVGILVILILATTFSPPVRAEEDGTDGVPLYILQLQRFTERLEREKVTFFNYKVQKGDSLTAIARRFGTRAETLAHLNNIVDPHLIYTGQTLQVVTVPGAVHRVEPGETVASIARLYGVEPGSVIAVNRDSPAPLLQRGERVLVTGTVQGPAAVCLGWPVTGGHISSRFGWRDGEFHYGLDLAVPLGTPIYAAAAGTVTYSGYRGSYGLMIELEHEHRWQTRYAHAGRVSVSVGERVAGGQLLGEVGLTGNTTGAHLHFEVLHRGIRLDPLPVLLRREF
ncbi:MAG: M23 family metallopeptidase [Firmicutes bacterium]|nr:M23 family metallopeptidase [Bacillota bacterium]